MNSFPRTRRARAYVRMIKSWRKTRARLFGFDGHPIESEEWGTTIIFHGGTNSDGESVETVLRQCPVCAAFVLEGNRAYHYKWHFAGSA